MSGLGHSRQTQPAPVSVGSHYQNAADPRVEVTRDGLLSPSAG